MLKNPIKIGLLIVMLSFCSNLYAETFNITININGEEYYSDENGFSDKTSTQTQKKSAKALYPTSSRRNSYSLSANRSKYADLVAKAADRHQVDTKLLHAVIQAESAYNATAISSAGAVGLMQLMPDTARRYGVTDRNNPSQNIDGGTRYLKHLLQLFDSNLNLAIAAYNAGENAVIKHHNSIPPYPETRNYVKQVLSLKGYIKYNDDNATNDMPSYSDTDTEE